MRPKVIVITGPTASGKSAIALDIAERERCHIISADSRQIYRQLPITSAAPSAEDLARVPHHFVGTLDLQEYYSASLFESQSIALLAELHKERPVQVVCGGSMMYVDALINGLDPLPDIPDYIRLRCKAIFDNEGIEPLIEMLRQLDPAYLTQVALDNPRRIIHAVEICLAAERPYSELRSGKRAERPFDVEAYYINVSREELFTRINSRTEAMVAAGMLDEVAAVAHLRHLNSMNTVGVKEMLRVVDGDWSLEFATARLQKNTRVYAKKQLTWLRAHPEIHPLP